MFMQPGALPRSTGHCVVKRAQHRDATNSGPSQVLSHPICQMGTIIPTPPSSSKLIELKALWK